MAGERTYPILPCPDLDVAIAFYEMLGFTRTYRQLRPNPYGVVTRSDLQVHLAGMDNFDPSESYASTIVTVPDVGEIYDAFEAGLKNGMGRVPRAGIPRLLRIRAKSGTATGFSLVDPGGNWLRFFREGDSEDSADHEQSKLQRVIAAAARQGDARGDDAAALAILDRGLDRYSDAEPEDVAEAVAYRSELIERLRYS